MSHHHEIWSRALDLSRRGVSFVVITVIRTKGSTPRDPGAAMIWRPGEGFIGTVGGGQFEQLVLDAAETHHENRTSGTEAYTLGADADQCCGGTMEVFFEYVGSRHTVVLFGAGHVAFEVARLLGSAPVRTVIVDDRAEWNTEERFACAHRVLDWSEGVGACRERKAETLVCVMTCSHDTDFDLLRELLQDPPAFVGLIGSRSKRACLFGRLVASGIDENVVRRVHCPIGVGDTGKEPSLVAVSIAAQILMEVRRADAGG
ncbi:MAG: xanthine dehydrogenase accessory protein XdhC [Phycisphaerales bacterium]|nr:xanthine dehydrogenase accessory protein XdhC [Phycisphaerales bacterium]